MTERLEIENADVETSIVAGDEDTVGPPVLCVGMKVAMQKCVDVAILKETAIGTALRIRWALRRLWVGF